jgi:phosphatidylglycerophosphate synthase
MFDDSLRRARDRVGDPLIARLGKLSPNHITWVALIAGLICAALAWQGQVWGSVLFWSLNRILDALDGMVARVHHRQTDFGGYLDIVLDFVIYAVIPFGLVLNAPSLERYFALTFMLISFYVNSASWMYLAAILEKRNARDPELTTTVIMPAGLMGALETIIVYYVFLLFPAHIVPLFFIFGGLVFVTVLQRLIWAWKTL